MSNSQKVVLVVGLIILWAILGYAPYWLSNSPDTFGNAFGMANSFFSCLALACVVFTLYMQHQELTLQREELQKSVEAQQRSSEALEKQSLLSFLSSYLDTQITLINVYDQEIPKTDMEKCKIYLNRQKAISNIKLMEPSLEKQIKDLNLKDNISQLAFDYKIHFSNHMMDLIRVTEIYQSNRFLILDGQLTFDALFKDMDMKIHALIEDITGFFENLPVLKGTLDINQYSFLIEQKIEILHNEIEYARKTMESNSYFKSKPKKLPNDEYRNFYIHNMHKIEVAVNELNDVAKGICLGIFN